MATPARTLAPPRAAAVAGVMFSVLMGSIMVIARLVVPPNGTDSTAWLNDPLKLNAVRFGIQLAPFAGIAFLWFIAVLRNRLGQLEDQFFATVFLGSGLLFVASLFLSASLAGALFEGMALSPTRVLNNDAYFLARQMVRGSMNVFGIKMAGVFIMSTSTIVFRTGILPRWIALSGFACAVVLLLVMTSWPWITLLFPLWMLLVSAHILVAEFHPARATTIWPGLAARDPKA